MGRLLVLILGLAVVAFCVKYALEARASPENDPIEQFAPSRRSGPPGQHTRPREQLDNVRDKTHELERQMQKAADDAARNLDTH